MSCGCGGECCRKKDALLAGLSGPLMSGLIAAGTDLKVGFELGIYSYDLSDARRAELQRCLLDTGGFSEVVVTVQQGAFRHPYVTVEAVASQGFSKASDFGDLVQGVIQACPEWGDMTPITRRDPVQVVQVPPAVSGDTSYEQPARDGGASSNGGVGFVDDIANTLGVDTGTVLIGGIGMLFVLGLTFAKGRR